MFANLLHTRGAWCFMSRTRPVLVKPPPPKKRGFTWLCGFGGERACFELFWAVVGGVLVLWVCLACFAVLWGGVWGVFWGVLWGVFQGAFWGAFGGRFVIVFGWGCGGGPNRLKPHAARAPALERSTTAMLNELRSIARRPPTLARPRHGRDCTRARRPAQARATRTLDSAILAPNRLHS